MYIYIYIKLKYDVLNKSALIRLIESSTVKNEGPTKYYLGTILVSSKFLWSQLAFAVMQFIQNIQSIPDELFKSNSQLYPFFVIVG